MVDRKDKDTRKEREEGRKKGLSYFTRCFSESVKKLLCDLCVLLFSHLVGVQSEETTLISY